MPEVDPEEVLSRPAEGPDVIVRYAEHADGLIDVFLPPSLGRPARRTRLIFAVHGGFWRQNFDRRHLRPLANALAARGFVVALPEYRRVNGSPGWPLPGDDVAAALAAAPALVEAAAPGRLAADEPCILTGHSAGGHLAMWAGLRAGRQRVSRVVALAPVSDLAYGARTKMGNGAVLDLMGGGPDDEPERYAEADVLAMLPGDVPVTIIQGTQDKQVTVLMNRQLAARFPSLTYVECEGVEHFALIDPLSGAFETEVLSALTGD